MKTLGFGYALGSLVLLAACSGGGDTTVDAQLADAPDGVDAPDEVDAPPGSTCAFSTGIGPQQLNDQLWIAPPIPELELSAGFTAVFQLEFYDGIRPSLVGTWDLSDAVDGNYKTCASCIRMFILDEAGQISSQYFQSEGSLTLDADPLTGALSGSVTGLKMVEVTIAEDFTSTPVADGDCVDVAESALGTSVVPAEWTCGDATYNDGTTCDCSCGAPDPDCDDPAAPINGCAAGQVCTAQGTCQDPGACETSSIGAQAFVDGTADFSQWSGLTVPDLNLNPGETSEFQLEFYGGIRPDLVGTWDLTDAIDGNYRTCASCVRLFVRDQGGTIIRQYFQSAGSLTLAVDPFSEVLSGSVTGLEMVEVTIAADFTSTPVPGGACLTVNDSTLDADNIPAEWTCGNAAYADGTTCDCGCGAPDPDCDDAAAPVSGCTGGQICVEAVCQTTCQVLGTPQGCTTGTCGFFTATEDICYTEPGLIDAAAVGQACGADTTFCQEVGTIAQGLCDNFVNQDGICRLACDSEDDCPQGDSCEAIVGDKGICLTPPPPVDNDTCSAATPVTLGTSLDGTTIGSNNDYNAGLEVCTGFSQAGPDVAYSISLTQGQTITVALTNVSVGLDPALAILGPGAASCDVDPLDCPAGNGVDANLDADGESFQFTAPAAGDYYIIVDTFFADGTGTFTLTVN